MNALVYVVIDQGIHKIKMKVAQNEKRTRLKIGFQSKITSRVFDLIQLDSIGLYYIIVILDVL